MAKKWSEVESNPEFVAMPYEQKLEVRQEYFDNVVAPHVPENLRGVEYAKFTDYATIEAPTTGLGGALGSSIDRLQAGYQTLTGDHEAAAANITESRKYEPTISSYKDIKDVDDALSYASELVAGSVPYLTAPVVAATAATVGAPVTWPAAIATGGAMLYGALEGGATYAEQENKDVTGAAITGIVSGLLERLPGMQGKTALLMNSPLLRKTLTGTVDELAATTGQVLTSNMIGHGMSFDDSIANIDEALVGSAITRASISAPSSTVSKVAKGNRDKILESGNVFAEDLSSSPSRKADEADLHDSVTAPDRTVESVAKSVDNIWKGREFENTAEAAKKLQERGAELSPVALDFEATTRDGKVNLAKAMGIGTGADKVSRIMASNFKVPFFGSLVDPKQGYDTTKNAYKGLKGDFDSFIKAEIGDLNVPKPVQKEISRDIQDYVMGRKPSLEESTKTILTMSPDSLGVFDQIVQVKRMRQMTEKMAPRGTGGTLGGALGLGTEAVITGGIPVFSASIGTVGSTLAAGLNKAQKSKMKSIIVGDGTSESKIEAFFKLLDEMGVAKAGFADDLEEEVKAKTKVDMGILEVAK